MLSYILGPLRFLAHAALSPSEKPAVTPANLTYHCTTPQEARERGLELRDPPERGWQEIQA